MNSISWLKIAVIISAIFLIGSASRAQVADAPGTNIAGIPVNYTEALVGNYTLPDPLKLSDGKPVSDAKTWLTKRRPEIIRLYEENQFGRSPAVPKDISFNVFDKGTATFNAKAIRKQVTIYFSKDKSGPSMDLLIYLPADATNPVPILLNFGFSANNLMVPDDPSVKIGQMWSRTEKRLIPANGGRGLGRLNVLPLLDKGFGVATFNYADIDPDTLGAVSQGVRGLYLKPGQTEPASDEWGSIAAWGWGMSRVLDYFEKDKDIDAKRVAIMGVSRLGKTVLWAAARDTRVALVIASCSGEGGAALSRRNYGETIAHLTAPTRYPYQFCGNYKTWGSKVNEFPVDANMLVALIAPRPVLLQTGDTDHWSDPKGEFLAAVAATPVFRLLGKAGVDTDQMPQAGQMIGDTLSYYMHSGGHGTVPGDWDVFIKFMEKNLKP